MFVMDKAFVGIASIVILGFLERAGLLPVQDHAQNYLVTEDIVSWACTTVLVIAWLTHHTIMENQKNQSSSPSSSQKSFSLQPLFNALNSFIMKKPDLPEGGDPPNVQ